MPSKQRELYVQFNQITDALLIAVVFWLAHALRENLAFYFPLRFTLIADFRYYKWLYLIILPLCPFLMDINGFYSRPHRMRRRLTLWILVKSVSICALIVIAAMYFLGLAGLSRGVIILFAIMTVAALFIKDLIFQAYLRLHAEHGRLARPVILVGSEDRNADFERLLEEHPEWDFAVVAKIDPSRESLERLPEMLHTQAVSCVVFNVTQTHFSEVEKAILACEVEGVEAWLVADFVRTSIARATIDDFHGKPVLVFRTTPEVSWQLVCKRIIDIVGSVVGLVILGPLVMLPTAIGIRLTSPGPILFRQKRSGLHGRLFTMYKFRSMVTNAEMLRAELEAYNEMSGPVFKMTEDPRVTPIGRFMRRFSIDEFPQFWNVLKGEMSLVGPRPPIPSEVQQYDPWHRRRLSMKPGLTCLWQTRGRNKIGFEQWMNLDLQYIDHWSLWLDLKILLRTVPIVLSGMGAR
jgi:exopolysaccharide biosynthesis polyprenyl glycosylphosphotransferase